MSHNSTHTTKTTPHKFFQRGVAFCFAAMLTLAMLGGIDHLATSDAPPTLWAAHTASRA